MSNEQWKPVPGFEGRYEISNEGRVRSVARSVSSPRHGKSGRRNIKSRILAFQYRSAGYPQLSLVSGSGDVISKQVHRMVAEAFVKNPQDYPEVNHLDADRRNSRADNLEWCTHSMNMAYAYRIGNRPIGAQHHFANLERDERGRCKAASR